MAGLGRKTFASGEVLTAANTQGYLMDQSVMVFADEAARTSAIAAPTEGMFSYLSDTDDLEYYSGSAWVAAGADVDPSLFYKSDFGSVVFTKTGAGTADIKAGTKVTVGSSVVTYATATAITMPTLTAGTDYFIYSTASGAEAVAATGVWPSAVASPPASSRLIGGFHYAAGGNAAAQAGGDTTAAINEYSLWDLKWRPSAPDPRGMTLVSNSFWADIYLLNRDPQTYGTSKNNQPIADGATASTTTAIVPTAFGGNGSTRYATQSWWNTAECLSAFGKRLPRYSEFGSLAYGTTENQSRGNDPVNTGLGTSNTGSSNTDEEFTSRWGVIQASGVMYVWGNEFGGGNAAASWADINGGRGKVYQQENAVFLGGAWYGTVDSGSRTSRWTDSPSLSDSVIGGRGVCDHLRLV